ncbi:hypothetical protein LDENG_00287690%2C partial [Scomber scombrus]|uniref:Peptidase A2 domain-containing protein n=1 Tax=Scomber scombrus TaxID=13677 RepID=A0AAV1PCS7_SCOSC
MLTCSSSVGSGSRLSHPLAAQAGFSGSAASRPSEVEPMQLGRAKLSPDERLRRMRACTVATRPGQKIRLVSRFGGSGEPHFFANQVFKTFSFTGSRLSDFQTDCVSLQALIDSGAEANLLDLNFATEFGCNLDKLNEPIPAVAMDGNVFTQTTL